VKAMMCGAIGDLLLFAESSQPFQQILQIGSGFLSGGRLDSGQLGLQAGLFAR